MVAEGSRVRPLAPYPYQTDGFFCSWHKRRLKGGHVRSARAFQKSTCSAIAKASSTSMPRYLTVLSILVGPNKSWSALRFPKFENVSSILRKF